MLKVQPQIEYDGHAYSAEKQLVDTPVDIASLSFELFVLTDRHVDPGLLCVSACFLHYRESLERLCTFKGDAVFDTFVCRAQRLFY